MSSGKTRCNPSTPLGEKLTRRYGLKVGGGRTRIRTRVFGLEGQSDIQLHYTSLTQWQG